MQKVNMIEKVLKVLPAKNHTRFHKLTFENGIQAALKWVLGQGQLPFYAEAAENYEEEEGS